MRILAMSDLLWGSQTINTIRFNNVNHSDQIPNTSLYSYLKHYIQIVEKEKPDIVLFAGDLTGSGQIFIFLSMLHILENKKINTVFVSGNHDLEQIEYLIAVSYCDRFKYIHRCDGVCITINGLSILGLSFKDTRNKSILKKHLSTSKKVDIILSHCESGRRLSLFDFDTTYIFTGHFNSYVLYVDKKVFIALDNIPKTTPSPIIKTSYVTVDIGASRDKIQYHIDDNIYVFVKDEKSLSNKFENIDGYYAIIPKAMQLSMEKLVKLKKNNERINSDDMWQFPGIPISTINDYLGKKSDK